MHPACRHTLNTRLRTACPSRSLAGPRRALTLVEMLVGMAITLVMMAAVVNLFANVSGSVRNRRAAIEMSGTLRQARSQLARDLAGATCPAVPGQDPAAANGYLEIIEGGWSDSNPSSLLDGNTANGELDYATSIVPGTQTVDTSTGNVTDGGGLGDYDDILAMTVRSEGEPFVGNGRFLNNSTNLWEDGPLESQIAEVIWYAVENPADGTLGEPGMRTLYRRVLLVAPWVGPIDPTSLTPPITSVNEFYQRYDLSARYDYASNLWIPNTLSDLTKRENRFAHYRENVAASSFGFPHRMVSDAIVPNTTTPQFPTASPSPLHPFGLPFEFDPSDSNPANPSIPPTPNRQGQDVVLNDVLAWDILVYDPDATLVAANGTVLSPNDYGWSAPTSLADIVGVGAFVNLGWLDRNQDGVITPAERPSFPDAPISQLSFPLGFAASPLPLFTFPAIYDTWSTHYESDGINQDNGIPPLWRDMVDQGTNKFDDDGINGVDDAGELESPPPYRVPLKAVKIIFRTYERDTRQIRETSVTHSFRD